MIHLQTDGTDGGTAYPMGESGRMLTPIGGTAARNACACPLAGRYLTVAVDKSPCCSIIRTHQYDWKMLQPSDKITRT